MQVLLRASSELNTLMEGLNTALGALVSGLLTLISSPNLSAVETQAKEIEVAVLIQRLEKCLDTFFTKVNSINPRVVRDLLMTDDLQTGEQGMSMQAADDAVLLYVAQVQDFHENVMDVHELLRQILETGTTEGWQSVLDTHVDQLMTLASTE
jgi:hypothetical protein